MMSYVVVHEIRKVVEAVSIELTPALQIIDSNITGVHYDHGHPLEIIETLREKDTSNNFRFKKYPLVALFQDFPEHSSDRVGEQAEATLHLIIAMTTQPDYKAAQRYQFNIEPIIYPIYWEFMYQLSRSKAFMIKSASQIPHTKYDRLYWGREGLMKNEANLFNDWIDCIEIKNLKLKVNQKLC